MRVRNTLIDELVNELMISHPDIFQAPINIDTLIERLHIRVVESDFGSSVSGAAIVEGNMRIISVNGGESENRKRFTKAHELGHHLLHRDRPLSVDVEPVASATFLRDHDSTTGEDWREVEANRFAAAVLMPKALIKGALTEMVQDALDEDEIVDILAKRFRVSIQAMCIRLGYLGY